MGRTRGNSICGQTDRIHPDCLRCCCSSKASLARLSVSKFSAVFRPAVACLPTPLEFTMHFRRIDADDWSGPHGEKYLLSNCGRIESGPSCFLCSLVGPFRFIDPSLTCRVPIESVGRPILSCFPPEAKGNFCSVRTSVERRVIGSLGRAGKYFNRGKCNATKL